MLIRFTIPSSAMMGEVRYSKSPLTERGILLSKVDAVLSYFDGDAGRATPQDRASGLRPRTAEGDGEDEGTEKTTS